MRILFHLLVLSALCASVVQQSADAQITDPVKVEGGLLSGVAGSDNSIRSYKGIPFAAPPVGELRWKAPQPVKRWEGVRSADHFGPRAMQLPVFGDMVFRSDGMSEDCLYLNVWTPAKTSRDRLPVLVYFYGGGFVGGDGSEPRYDGESMARRGIVAVTVNYRLGIFGFFTHPDLARESPHHASGNYGLLDQSAALQWVHKNIAAFGGDPKKITIGGESAGSFSVSAQMASPLSRGLIAGAIGESGAMFGATLAAVPLSTAEKNGASFASQNSGSLAGLRAMTAQQLLDASKSNPFRFGLVIDGYFLPKPAIDIYTAGEQAHVPLLAGWNAEEMDATAVLRDQPVTVAGLSHAVHALYGDRADAALKVYRATDDTEVKQVAVALASARFTAYGTWKWIELQGKTSGKPVYRYLFARSRPGENGAYHSVEIEYALGNLALNTKYAWTDEDRKLSETMQSYFANFIKTGDPNGQGLPQWSPISSGGAGQVMHLDVETRAEAASDRDQFLFLDTVYMGKP
jgi:para-nitrobenzyl esterase